MTIELNEDIVRYFQKHLAPIHFKLNLKSASKNYVISAFVLDVSGAWFLVTSAHVLQELETDLNNNWEIESCLLVDTLATDAGCKIPNPFPYNPDDVFYFDPDKGLDFGVIWIPELIRMAMEKNGLTPLDQQTWSGEREENDEYLLLGVPSELNAIESDLSEVNILSIYIDPLEEMPAGFEVSQIERFYGRLRGKVCVESIKGMSGGPILALREVDGQLRYWLHAVQSSWLPASKEIAACPVRPFAYFIEKKLEDLENC